MPLTLPDRHWVTQIKRWLPDIGVFAALWLIFVGANHTFKYVADDLWWLELRTAGRFDSVWELMAWHYNDWSARVLSHGAVYLTILHPLIWRIVTALAFAVAAYVPVLYLGKSLRSRIVLALASLIMLTAIPGALFYETGYLTTSAVYLWTWAAALIAAYPAVKYLKGQRCQPALMAAAALALVFAANFELIAVFLLVAFTAAIIVQARRQLPYRGLIPFAVFSLLAIVFSLTAPGNANRVAEELAQFPGYEQLGLLNRVEMGYSSALRSIFMNGYLAPVFFFSIVLLLLLGKRDSLTKIGLAAIPLLGAMVLSFQGGLFWVPGYPGTGEGITTSVGRYLAPYQAAWLPQLFTAPFQRTGLLRAGDTLSIIVFLTLTALLALTIAALYWVLGSTWRFWLTLGILGLAFASKAIVAFSPTVWASGSRTDLYILLGFGLATLIIIEPIFANYWPTGTTPNDAQTAPQIEAQTTAPNYAQIQPPTTAQTKALTT